jgi:hypothetical protein
MSAGRLFGHEPPEAEVHGRTPPQDHPESQHEEESAGLEGREQVPHVAVEQEP